MVDLQENHRLAGHEKPTMYVAYLQQNHLLTDFRAIDLLWASVQDSGSFAGVDPATASCRLLLQVTQWNIPRIL